MLSIFTPGRVSSTDDASNRPSGLHPRFVTASPRSGVSVKSSRPLAASLILIERDFAAEAIRLPSWLKANTEEPALGARSDFGGTGNERGWLAAFTSQSLTLTPACNIAAAPGITGA